MGRRFFLGGRAKTPTKQSQIRTRLINNTVNHPTMDAICRDEIKRGNIGLGALFRLFIHGHKRFTKTNLLRMKRSIKRKLKRKE